MISMFLTKLEHLRNWETSAEVSFRILGSSELPACAWKFSRILTEFLLVWIQLKKTYDNLIEIIFDIKATWHRISSLLYPNRTNSHLKLEVHDDIIRDSTIKSTFNTHFSEAAPSLNTRIPSLPDNTVGNSEQAFICVSQN